MKARISIGHVLMGTLLISMQSLSQVKTNHSSPDLKKEKMSSIENVSNNKTAIRNLYENILNKRKLELLTNIVSDDYTNAQGEKGATAFQQPLLGLIKAFPDAHWDIQDIVAEGNKVIVLQKFTGTQNEQFQNIEPTHKFVATNGVSIYELNNGKIVASQIQTDRLGFLQDLGILPTNITSATAKKNEQEQVALIDKIFVPKSSIDEVLQQMHVINTFLKTLPGLVRTEAFEQKDADGNLILVTTAIWENQHALDSAQKSVRAEFERLQLNPSEFFKKLNVKMERAVYNRMEK